MSQFEDEEYRDDQYQFIAEFSSATNPKWASLENAKFLSRASEEEADLMAFRVVSSGPEVPEDAEYKILSYREEE